MATNPDLYLNGIEPKVKVLPMVYLGILDHYSRRQKYARRVIGTLLGTEVGGVTEITNYFPVPHEESVDQVTVDTEYHRTMFELHRQVNPKEVIVGWYATGSEITEYSALIHDFYSLQCDTTVHLCIDTEVADGRIGINAYVGAPMGVPDHTVGKIFTPVEVSTLYYEPERVGLKALTKTLETDDKASNVQNDMERIAESVESLDEILSMCVEYVDKVLSKEIPGDEKIGRFLMDTISRVPQLDAAEFEKMFNNSLQDLLMVTYLSSLVQANVSLQEVSKQM
mmetsp:Transcript_8541/g.21982  ORF Transcript_8541/g.21982 Transcript_8541/m.21982 type:complete len:282 (-) Transcript_8541:358-1203(-)